MNKKKLIISSVWLITFLIAQSVNFDRMHMDICHNMEYRDTISDSSRTINECSYYNDSITYCKIIYDIGWSRWVFEIDKVANSSDADSISYNGFMRQSNSNRKMYFPPESSKKMISMVDSLFISKTVPFFAKTKNKYGDAMSSSSEYLDVIVKCQNNYEFNEKFRITDTYGGYDYEWSPTCRRLLKMLYWYTVMYAGPDHLGPGE